MPKTSLDAIDRKILKYLIKNARMPFLEIARECGISGAAIHQRIRKLDDSGVILGSRLIVDPKMMGFDVCAHISITLKDPQLLKQTVEQLKEIPEIVEAHFITGSGNILVKLYCVDNEHLMRTIFDGILRIQGVASTETQISLQEAFQRQVNIDFIEEYRTTPLSQRRRPEIPASAFVSVHAGAQAAVPGPGRTKKVPRP